MGRVRRGGGGVRLSGWPVLFSLVELDNWFVRTSEKRADFGIFDCVCCWLRFCWLDFAFVFACVCLLLA